MLPAPDPETSSFTVLRIDLMADEVTVLLSSSLTYALTKISRRLFSLLGYKATRLLTAFPARELIMK